MAKSSKRITYSRDALLALKGTAQVVYVPEEIRRNNPESAKKKSLSRLVFWGSGLCNQPQHSSFKDDFDRDNGKTSMLIC